MQQIVVPVRKTEQSCTVVVVEARRAEAVLLLLCTPDADGKAAVEKSVAAAMAPDEWCSSNPIPCSKTLISPQQPRPSAIGMLQQDRGRIVGVARRADSDRPPITVILPLHRARH